MASHVWAEHDLVAYFVRRRYYRVLLLKPVGSFVLKKQGQSSGEKFTHK
jgi:hypothetical protein